MLNYLVLKLIDSFQYSDVLNTLFVNRNRPCKVEFKTSIPAQLAGLYQIRTKIKYVPKERCNLPVLRCMCHVNSDAKSQYVLHSENVNAIYQVVNGHYTVVEPLEVSNENNLALLAAYRFGCFSSCKEIDRNPIKLVFTLETLRYADPCLNCCTFCPLN